MRKRVGLMVCGQRGSADYVDNLMKMAGGGVSSYFTTPPTIRHDGSHTFCLAPRIRQARRLQWEKVSTKFRLRRLSYGTRHRLRRCAELGWYFFDDTCRRRDAVQPDSRRNVVRLFETALVNVGTPLVFTDGLLSRASPHGPIKVGRCAATMCSYSMRNVTFANSVLSMSLSISRITSLTG
jgi:hypothetical protein